MFARSIWINNEMGHEFSCKRKKYFRTRRSRHLPFLPFFNEKNFTRLQNSFSMWVEPAYQLRAQQFSSQLFFVSCIIFSVSSSLAWRDAHWLTAKCDSNKWGLKELLMKFIISLKLRVQIISQNLTSGLTVTLFGANHPNLLVLK
jgi:hypothetical protein